MYPTILNVVVDSRMRHWVAVVAPMEAGSEGLGKTIQELEDFFYADDGIVKSPRTERLHRVFNILTDIFGRFGLHKNVWKRVSMSCWPCYNPGVFWESVYTRRVTGIGPSYQERLRWWIQ